MYVEEKIGLAQQATDVKNMGGFIVKAIRENYQDPVFQRELQVRKAENKRLDALKAEMHEKKGALLRQAVRKSCLNEPQRVSHLASCKSDSWNMAR